MRGYCSFTGVLLACLLAAAAVEQEGAAGADTPNAEEQGGQAGEEQPVSKLIEDLASDDKSVRLAAARALAEIGPAAAEAAPALVAAVDDYASEVEYAARRALKKIFPDLKKRLELYIDRLQNGGRRARTASAELLEDMDDEDVDIEPGVSALLEAMKEDEESKVRAQCAYSLRYIKSRNPAVVPALIAAFEDEDFWVRWRVVFTLTGVFPPAEQAYPVYLRALADRYKETRAAAAEALGTMGPRAAGAVPKLRELFDDDNEDVRVRAVAAVAMICRDEHSAQAVVEMFGHVEKDLSRNRLCEALAGMGPAGKLGVNELVGLMQQQDFLVGPSAAFALARLAPHVPSALGALEQTLAYENKSLRRHAAVAILKMKPEHARARAIVKEYMQELLPYWLKDLDDADTWLDRPGRGRLAGAFRVYFSEICVLLGSDAIAADPLLKRIARDAPDPESRQAATRALEKIADQTSGGDIFGLGAIGDGIAAGQVGEHWVGRLQSEYPTDRRRAAEQMQSYAECNEHRGALQDVRPVLETLAQNDPDETVRAAAARALAAIEALLNGEGGQNVARENGGQENVAGPNLATLIEQLKSDDHSAQLEAAKALGAMGPAAAAALDALEEVPGNTCSAELFVEVLDAIHKIRGGEEEEADPVGQYVGKLRSPDVGDRLEAIQELQKLGPQAAAAVPALTQVAEGDVNPYLRKLAQEALAAIGAEEGHHGAEPPPVVRRSLVGTWTGSFTKLGVLFTDTSEFGPDGTLTSVVRTRGRIVAVLQGTYTYREGVLTFAYNGGESETAQIVWMNDKQFSCTANGAVTVYRPAAEATSSPPAVPNWSPQPWTPPVVPPMNVTRPYGW